MKVTFEHFKDFKEEKPETFDTCLILWKGSTGKEYLTVGIYYEDKKTFHDGIGASLEEDLVMKWCNVVDYTMEN